ncbi:MAG: hypothetical protein JRI23_23035 [Deltaproteobacteria bacterium]|jgi:hypothetical protein|nr:hypothetical protein [Deltaproteobacteria bacterium]MBW2534847.1 hypothetical protein [Deltaproteobacteria bacterium]
MRSQPGRRRQLLNVPVLTASLAAASPLWAGESVAEPAPRSAERAVEPPESDGASSSADTLLYAGISLLVVGAVAGGVGAALLATSQEETGDSAAYTGIGMIIGGGTVFLAGLPVTIIGGVQQSSTGDSVGGASFRLQL